MTKPAQNLLRDLLEYASHLPDAASSGALMVWDSVQEYDESAFRELELLANPVEREEMTDEQLSEYHENLNRRASEPLR